MRTDEHDAVTSVRSRPRERTFVKRVRFRILPVGVVVVISENPHRVLVAPTLRQSFCVRGTDEQSFRPRVGKKEVLPGDKVPGDKARVFSAGIEARRRCAIVLLVHGPRCDKLPQMARAHGPLRRTPRGPEDGEEQRRQQCDNRGHHKDLDERPRFCRVSSGVCLHRGATRTLFGSSRSGGRWPLSEPIPHASARARRNRERFPNGRVPPCASGLVARNPPLTS